MTCPFLSSRHCFCSAVALLLSVVILPSFVFAQHPCPLELQDRVVTICLPRAGDTSNSPIHVLGGGMAIKGVRTMQVYLDGVKVFEQAGFVADTNLIVSPGTHRLTLQAVDSFGTFKKSMDVTVGSRPYPRFAYVANSDDQTLSTYMLEAGSGFLRQNGYVLAGGHPSGIAETWRGFVYAVGGDDGKVYAYKKTYGGRLLPVSGSPYACGSNCAALAIDGTGRFLYTVDAASGALHGYRIVAGSGALVEVAGSPFGSGGIAPSAVTISPRGILFVTNEGSKNVAGFVIDPIGGALTPVAGSPTETGAGPHALALNPKGDRLYVADKADNTIYAYYVSQAGSLKGLQVIYTGTQPTALAVYNSGAFLYVAHEPAASITAYKVDYEGALHETGTFATGPKPRAIAVDGQGKFLLVTNAGAPYELWEYRIDLVTGGLKFARGTRTHGAGSAVAVSTGSAPVSVAPGFVYVGTADRSNFNGKLFAFTIGSNGTLAAVAGSPYSHPRGVTTLAAHPTGAMLYAPGLKLTDAFSGLVSQYWVNRSTGVLTAAAPYIHPEEFETHNMVLDPSGRFAYATSGYGVMEPWNTGWSVPAGGGPLGGWLFYPDPSPYSNFALDPIGKHGYLDAGLLGSGSELMAIDPVTGAWGYGPTLDMVLQKLVYDPTGRFAWALAGDEIRSFIVSGSTGMLKQVGTGLTTGSGAVMIAVDPYGRFVYVANGSSNSVSAYKASLSDGSLTRIGTHAFAAGSGPVGLVIDATGKYLYVANGASMDVSGFAINQTTGALGALPGSPWHLAATGTSTAIATISKVQ